MPRLSKIGAAALAAFGWTSGGAATAVTASYLQVAGGGGGGGTSNTVNSGGGGGAGGLLSGTTSLNPTLSYTVIVGAGGAGALTTTYVGTQGSNSQFDVLTASVGGGFGQGLNTQSGGSGGSGGGTTFGGGSAGAGTVGQGNAGGIGHTGSGGGGSGDGYNAGGGGGAGAVGSAATGASGGNGGIGALSSISGTSTYYAGGGGGGSDNFRVPGVFSTGGLGGGGAGGNASAGIQGTANTGGGGGGASLTSGGGAAYRGGNGGSGVVIISYAGAQQFGGGVVTSVGGNTIHTFTTSGTLSPLSSLTASYLIVGGGAGGGCLLGGGGGAGGYVSGSSLTIDTNSTYLVTVGAGGLGSTSSSVVGSNGTSSAFSLVSTSSAGGGGGGSNVTPNGASGASGGGAAGAGPGGTGGAATQGFAGGNSPASSPYPAGGGGGSSAVGAAGSGSASGAGGAGTASSISGSSVTYAGGGGGSGNTTYGASAGAGGSGGGGAGGNSSTAGSNATLNTGSGGGGGGTAGGNGGSGIVIISYPGSTPQMAGGTVTAAGGNIIHTFTSSGYLTPITNLNNSLRFRSSASAYLSRTPTVAGNRQIWTWSAWVKRGALGTTQALFGVYTDTNNRAYLHFQSGDTIAFLNRQSSVTDTNVATTSVFRDPAAWYHIILSVDTTQATGSNRIKLFVNNVQQTLTFTTTPSQNTNLYINTTQAHRIGDLDGTVYFDGYMADINFIDGQALTPSSFGATNGQGVWQPVRYGGSYGTNGFYLPFTANTVSFAGSFNGSNQSLSVANNVALQFGTGDFTVEFWVNQASLSGFQTAYALGYVGANDFLIQTNTGTGNWIAYMQGIAVATESGTTVSTGTWYHMAFVRSGSTMNIYRNGRLVASGSGATTNLNSTSTITIGTASTFPLNGALSNLRVVKGTAVYTSNFKPATSNLTAISGTSLLTLQNATIVDNSTNAFTITNNNGVTTGQTYPFSAGYIFDDQSPQGNNWTPNNISGISGSTLDYMTDVPTNTSATVANYCVLNPLKNTASISNANLQTVNAASAGYYTSYATMSMDAGKYYWEITVVDDGVNSRYLGIGVADPSIALTGSTTSAFTGTQAGNARGWAQTVRSAVSVAGTGLYNNGSTVNSTTRTTTSGTRVFMVAYDADNGKCWMGYEGTWWSGDPAAGTSQYFTATAPMVPVFNPYNDGSISTFVTSINFGQRPFAYTPPSGFVALNTFNLPTPTIGATPATTANKYFDVSLYTGNGSTQTITNSGSMQPDFVWAKVRSTGYSHRLVDSVRGATKLLYSDLTNAEATDANSLTSFNSNGFSLGNAAGTNDLNQTFVAWQWRASNATAVTNTAGSITSSVSANTTAGFSIVSYTTQSSGTGTVGHGLGAAPSLIILKNTALNNNWIVYHTSLGASAYLYLNTTAATISDPSVFNGTNPTSTVFSMGTGLAGSISTIAYCFAQVAGYSAFGSYTGNGSTDGPFIYTGFRPKFVMIKCTSLAGSFWVMQDTVRNTYNVINSVLYPNSSAAEATTINIDALSNGFKLRTLNSDYNNSGSDTYIYAAFAESPFKYANAR